MLESPIINPASVVKEPEMESTQITQEGDAPKENVATTSAQEVEVEKGQEKKEEKIEDQPLDVIKINWKETLGHCTDEALAKTLEHTTQFPPHFIEAENQSYPPNIITCRSSYFVGNPKYQ
eukprot:19142-Ditylum_brightwellii.AAC.1